MTIFIIFILKFITLCVVFGSWSLEPGPFATYVGYMKKQRVPQRANLKGGLKGRFGLKWWVSYVVEQDEGNHGGVQGGGDEREFVQNIAGPRNCVNCVVF